MSGREFRIGTQPVMASTQAWCGTGIANVVMVATSSLAARQSVMTSMMVTGTQMRRSIKDGDAMFKTAPTAIKALIPYRRRRRIRTGAHEVPATAADAR